MKLSGSYTFDAPREEVWQALLDPDVLAKTMPGCERLDKTGDNQYKGALKIRVGPVQGQFQGRITLSDLNPPEGYRMEVDGKGPAGFVKGQGKVRLEEQDSKTVMHYEGDAQVGGRIASVGQRLMDSSARALTNQALDALHQQVKARAQGREGSEPPPAVEAPSQSQFAVGVAREVLADLVPSEERPRMLAVGLAVLGMVLMLRFLSAWWIDRLARRVADIILERR
ncbi:MAG: carbon monoxide dehydrogenase subunit G [Anaerolineae bacterium]